METSRCCCRPVANLDFGGPACFFLPDLARDSAGSPPCWLYALVPPAFLPLERFCFFVNLHGDWEVSVYGSEIVPVALGHASDHVSDMGCRCSQHPYLSLTRPTD